MRSEIRYSDIESKILKNQLKSRELLKDKTDLFLNFFNIQQELFHINYPGIFDPYYFLQEYERIIIQSYFKNIYLLFTCHNLILSGNYGAANILQRQIFEFLLLGKFVCLKKDNEKAIKWLSRKQFDVYDNIIKLLEKPNKKSFHDLWIILCSYSHATTSSYQIGFNFKENKTNIFGSYIILLLFTRCNYHLLNSQFLNKRLLYRSNYYGSNTTKNKELKLRASNLKKSILELFSDEGKKIICDYESTWAFKK